VYFGAGSTLGEGIFFSGLIDDVRIHSASLRTGSVETSGHTGNEFYNRSQIPPFQSE
jgi:hypothetical protein